MIKKIVLVIVFLVSIFFGYSQNSKTLYLKKGRKTIVINRGWIGLKTKNDTVLYFNQNELSYDIYKITKDSIFVSKPWTYHYEMTTGKTGYQFQNNQDNSRRLIETFKKNKIYYAAYLVIDTLNVKGYALKDIVSIDYPPEASNDSGCIFCVCLLPIPVFNIWFYYDMRKRWHPKTFRMAKWKITTN